MGIITKTQKEEQKTQGGQEKKRTGTGKA